MKKGSEITKEKIRTAFLELYAKKRIEQITIGELTTLAGVYRGTFYYYYTDIFALLNEIEATFFKEFFSIASSLLEGLLNNDMKTALPRVNVFLEKNNSLCQLFLVQKPSSSMERSLKACGKKTVLQKLGTSEETLTAEAAYYLEYIIGAQYALVTLWLAKGRDITAESLIHIVKTANLNGALTSLCGILDIKAPLL